jgi:hypothetical protein
MAKLRGNFYSSAQITFRLRRKLNRKQWVWVRVFLRLHHMQSHKHRQVR